MYHMEHNELLEQLDNAIAARSVISIGRPDAAETELLCIPIARSDELLLVHIFYDFYPDGYRVVRIEDIYDVLRDGSELFFERILGAEGVYANLKAPSRIDLSSWKNLLTSLKGRFDYCIVECDDEEDFLIGRVMEIRDWDFTFWYFDATGKWDEELDLVDYEDLTAVSFDDNYTKTIIKYIPHP